MENVPPPPGGVNKRQYGIYNYSSPPRFWETKDVDDIFERGDETCFKIAQKGQNLCFSDIPQYFATISDSYHGTINGNTDYPFYSLCDAINILLGKHIVSGCIFCMGQTTPGYASAILRNDDHFPTVGMNQE